MEWLAFGVVGLGYLGLMLFIAGNANERKELEAPPDMRGPEPPPDSTSVLAQIRSSPWTKLARAQGWPIQSQQLDPRRTRLKFTWGEGKDALHVHVLLQHRKDGALASSTRFKVPARQPQRGLMDNRRLMATAMSWQGAEMDRRAAGLWLKGLPGPQNLQFEAEDLLGSQHGMLQLTLPAEVGHVSEIRAGLRTLRTAFHQAQWPAWSGLAHAQSWHLSADASHRLPVLAGSLDGVPFRANLTRHGRAAQTQITSIAVPGPMPGMRLTHIDHGTGPSGDFKHPIAGTLIHASSPHMAAVRALVNNPQVFGPLLAVLHAFPGSELTGERITLRAERDLKLELMPALEAVASLSKALADHYAD